MIIALDVKSRLRHSLTDIDDEVSIFQIDVAREKGRVAAEQGVRVERKDRKLCERCQSWVPLDRTRCPNCLARLTVPQLQKLDGVRGAEVTGGATQHIKILPRPEAMAASGASIQSISEALSNNGALVPAGTIEEQGKTLSLQIGSPVDSLDAIKALPLGGTKNAATIGGVADVSITEDARTAYQMLQKLGLKTYAPDAGALLAGRY